MMWIQSSTEVDPVATDPALLAGCAVFLRGPPKQKDYNRQNRGGFNRKSCYPLKPFPYYLAESRLPTPTKALVLQDFLTMQTILVTTHRSQ
jgi:hypothetical protein